MQQTNGVFDRRMKRLDGTEEDLSDYLGKVVLIVNVASYCGYTYQYSGLEALYRRFKDRGFALLGFPANNFGAQEPGSEAEIADFCHRQFQVSFPMFAKISVKGADIHPLYAEITGQAPPVGGAVQWNFQKYLVNREGEVVAKYLSDTEPNDSRLIARIEDLLVPAP